MFGLTTTTTNGKRLANLLQPIFTITLMLFIHACSEARPGAESNQDQTSSGQAKATQASGEQRSYPEPPPPTTSATQILSGGWLLSGDGSEPQFDAIVVIRGAAIVGVGKRGSVDVPADSVGIDASGKWILPGSSEQLIAAFRERKHDQATTFSSTQLPAISVGRSADLVLLNSNPLTDPQALNDIHAVVRDGKVELVNADPS